MVAVINSFASIKPWSFLQHVGDLALVVALSCWTLPAVMVGLVHWDTRVQLKLAEVLESLSIQFYGCWQKTCQMCFTKACIH